MDRFLIQYRNSEHSTTGVAPAIRMRGALLRSPVVALSAIGDKVWVRKYLDKAQLWESAEVVGLEGRNIVDVKLKNGAYQRRHVEQTKQRLDDALDDKLTNAVDDVLDEQAEATIEETDPVTVASDPIVTTPETVKTRKSTRNKVPTKMLVYDKLGGSN